ncbi:MAG: N-acetyltransferase [Bacteroidales bacterium]|nr:N-acetyltransferase [Bacteroidales bacterium]
MEISIFETEANGMAFIGGNEGEENLAEMTWIKESDDYIIIDHTMVSDSLKGQGIGRKLLDRIVEMARERNLKIRPLCPFVKITFDRVPELKDLLYE